MTEQFLPESGLGRVAREEREAAMAMARIEALRLSHAESIKLMAVGEGELRAALKEQQKNRPGLLERLFGL